MRAFKLQDFGSKFFLINFLTARFDKLQRGEQKVTKTATRTPKINKSNSRSAKTSDFSFAP